MHCPQEPQESVLLQGKTYDKCLNLNRTDQRLAGPRAGGFPQVSPLSMAAPSPHIDDPHGVADVQLLDTLRELLFFVLSHIRYRVRNRTTKALDSLADAVGGELHPARSCKIP